MSEEACSYEAALAAARSIPDGMSPYDVCIAFEMDEAIGRARKGKARKKRVQDMLAKDAGALYDVAREAYLRSAGTCAPKDAAEGVVDFYLTCGFDLGKVILYTRSSAFALRKD